MTTSEILIENKRRLDEIRCEYNPLTGVGSLIPRYEFKVDEEHSIWLPESMTEEKSLISGGNMRDTVSNFDEAMTFLIRERIKYDFEFWGATCATIFDKETKQFVKFVLRLPQRKLLAKLIELFWKREPIWIVLLKARQWGGSTLVQLFMAWLQLFHFENWHSAIVGDVEEQARVIRGMYSRMAQYHPEQIQKITLSPFEGSPKTRIMVERGCIISIGSMQKPEGLRCTDLAMVHKSETGSWKETKGKKPEDIIQSLSGLPSVHGSVDIEESTAKGIGNYFHNSWKEAANGTSGKHPVFIPWTDISMYQENFAKEDEKIKLAETLGEYEQFLWSKGATLEGIKWYLKKRKKEGWSDPSLHWRMQAEFPTTAQEAFQNTGKRAFSPFYVEKCKVNCIKPEFVGEVFADNIKGRDALKNIEFKPTPNGDLRIWSMPDYTIKTKYRYVVPVDIGGRWVGADWSIIRVLDRLPLLYGGVPEYILTWKGHLDQDLVVWKAAQIAKAYCNGLLVPEQNSLKKEDENDEGTFFLTLLDELLEHYSNIFCRTDPEKIRQGAPARYGFHTGSNKPDLIANVNGKMRDDAFVEYDERVPQEYDSFELKSSGKYGAVDGAHDDFVMCSAIGLKVSDLMPLPVIIDETKSHKPTRRIVSEATI